MPTDDPQRPRPPVPADDWALFLDVDGCLLDFADRPDGVAVPAALRASLEALSTRLEGAIALVSGRSLATARAIATTAGRIQGRSVGVEVDPHWREADFGDVEGRTFDELARLYPDLATRLASGAWEIDWPRGETWASLAERVTEGRGVLLQRGEPVVVVSHGGPLRLAIAMASGGPPDEVALPPPGAVVWVTPGAPVPSGPGAA